MVSEIYRHKWNNTSLKYLYKGLGLNASVRALTEQYHNVIDHDVSINNIAKISQKEK